MSCLSPIDVQIGAITLISAIILLSSSSKTTDHTLTHITMTNILSWMSFTASANLFIALNVYANATSLMFNFCKMICEIIFLLAMCSYSADYCVYLVELVGGRRRVNLADADELKTKIITSIIYVAASTGLIMTSLTIDNISE